MKGLTNFWKSNLPDDEKKSIVSKFLANPQNKEIQQYYSIEYEKRDGKTAIENLNTAMYKYSRNLREGPDYKFRPNDPENLKLGHTYDL